MRIARTRRDVFLCKNGLQQTNVGGQDVFFGAKMVPQRALQDASVFCNGRGRDRPKTPLVEHHQARRQNLVPRFLRKQVQRSGSQQPTCGVSHGTTGVSSGQALEGS